eukprot:6824321-Prymnesium_polylepis.1
MRRGVGPQRERGADLQHAARGDGAVGPPRGDRTRRELDALRVEHEERRWTAARARWVVRRRADGLDGALKDEGWLAGERQVDPFDGLGEQQRGGEHAAQVEQVVPARPLHGGRLVVQQQLERGAGRVLRQRVRLCDQLARLRALVRRAVVLGALPEEAHAVGTGDDLGRVGEREHGEEANAKHADRLLIRVARGDLAHALPVGL